MKPKLKDVATAAGVSLTTASLVLSGKGRISSEVRRNVLRAAEELGYARKSRGGISSSPWTVGILQSIDYEWGFIWVFIRPLIEAIKTNMEALGVDTILLPIEQTDTEQQIVERIRRAGVHAVVSIHYGNADLFTALEQSGIPVVVVMNGNFQASFYSVCVDDYQGAYEGTLHLIELGHRNIAYVQAERPDLPMLLNDRFIGYRKAMEEHGLEIPADCIVGFDLSNRKQPADRLEAAFRKPNRPTAVFCLDDEIALRVYSMLEELGFAIPKDVSLIAPGDVLDYEQPYYPQITTMKINTAYMGEVVATMMQNRINHDPEDIRVLKVKQQLVRRGSSTELRDPHDPR